MASATGCFDVIYKEDELDIDFVSHPLQDGSIPASQQDLYLELMDVLLKIKSLSRTPGWIPTLDKSDQPDKSKQVNQPYFRLVKYVKNLAGCAAVGLQGDPSSNPANLVSPDLAKKELQSIKAEVLLNEGIEFKTRYIRLLGGTCLLWAAVFGTHLFSYDWVTKLPPVFSSNLYWFSPMAIGTLTGLWFSFVQRKKDMTFDDLAGFEADGIKPLYRCAFVIIIAAILYGLLKAKLINFGVGSSTFNIFEGSRWFPFLLGVAVGVTERAMGDTVIGALPTKK